MLSEEPPRPPLRPPFSDGEDDAALPLNTAIIVIY